jgi:DNA replication protein DnaC
MDDMVSLKPKLTRLKLSGVLETLNGRLEQAMKDKWPYSQFLDSLLSDEVERRDHKQLSRILVRSGLEPSKTLETFDFSFSPRLHEPTIRELAGCGFLERKENCFFLGPSGVGKSHLAQALGHEAARRGREVLFRRTCTLLAWIAAGRGDGSWERRMKQVAATDLLILDDFGLKPLSEEQQSDLYELICDRYEKASIIITSNRDFAEWMGVFSNPLMGSAAMDRLVHRGIKIVIQGQSYRLESFMKRAKSRATESDKEEAPRELRTAAEAKNPKERGGGEKRAS